MATTGWLTAADSTNLIVQVYDYYWEFREIGWSFKGRRWTYYQRRQIDAEQRTWVGMNDTVAKTKASGDLAATPTHESTDVALRTRAVRRNDAGAYDAQSVYFEDVSVWTTYAVTVHETGDA